MEKTTRPLPTTWQRPGKIKLRVCEGPDQGKEVVFDGACAHRLLGGRARINDLVLNDEHVSATHFELLLHPRDGVHLRDLGSRNGVMVERVRLIEAWLEPGAVFRVGNSTIQLISTDSVSVPLSPETRFGGLFGATPVMRELFAVLEKLAKADANLAVLVTGESGTGKELVAQALHERSSRRAAPFIAVNCATIAPQLAESHLFGHRRGSFTGATADRPGYFEAASGGTIFLDEIGELSGEVQAKLLRVLERMEVVRLGETRPRKVDVRVISATHCDLRKMVNENKFRLDLYFRLAPVNVVIPPLRDRMEDILPLTERFLDQLAQSGGARRVLGPDACKTLMAHSWPGNVRELRNAVEVAHFLADGLSISPADLKLVSLRPGEASVGLPASFFDLPIKEASREFERMYLRRLTASSGTLASKAKRAGYSDEGFRLARKRLRGELGDEERDPKSDGGDPDDRWGQAALLHDKC